MGRSLNTFQAEDLFYFAADPDPERIKPYSKHVEARYTLPQLQSCVAEPSGGSGSGSRYKKILEKIPKILFNKISVFWRIAGCQTTSYCSYLCLWSLKNQELAGGKSLNKILSELILFKPAPATITDSAKL